MKEATREDHGYDVRPYRPEFMSGVVDLMQYLWGGDFQRKALHFKWKYEDNPYVQSPPGIVALSKRKVVGFRGYCPTIWQIGETDNEINILSPGDTCVHPDHRRRGLSVLMGRTATAEYGERYRIFLNMSCSDESLPGYKRMGFLPLTLRSYVTRCNLFGMMRFVLTMKKGAKLKRSIAVFGNFKDVEVSDRPRPEKMSAVVAGHVAKRSRLKLKQDTSFFQWRFESPLPMNKYVFYFHWIESEMKGYVVLGVSLKNRRAFILDYAERRSGSIQRLLDFMIKMKHFDVISVLDFSIEDDLRPALEALRFRRDNLFGQLERKVYGELPLLIRPVKQEYVESDFVVKGLDTRKINNWWIKGISSDDA